MDFVLELAGLAAAVKLVALEASGALVGRLFAVSAVFGTLSATATVIGCFSVHEVALLARGTLVRRALLTS